MTNRVAAPRPRWLSRIASTLGSVIPPVVAAFLTISLTTFVSMEYEPGSFLRRLIAPEGEAYARAVPIATVFLFFWTLLGTFVQFVRVLVDQTVLSRGRRAARRGESLTVIAQHGGLLGRLVAPVAAFPGSAAQDHDVFRHQTEIEGARSAGRYTLMRLFVWAMPILGFIGTVLGIGLAVGEFSSFLTGDIEELETVKRELSKVSTGLSFAFDTTLLGLAGSLIGMIVVSGVQALDEGLLGRTEGFGLWLIAAGSADQDLDNPEPGQPAIDRQADLARVEQVAHSLMVRIDDLRATVDSYATLISGDGPVHMALSGVQVASEGLTRAAAMLAPLDSLVTRLDQLGGAQRAQSDALGRLERLPTTLARLADAQERASTDLRGIAAATADIGRFVEAEQRTIAHLESLRSLPGHLAALVTAHETLASKLDGVASVPRAVDAAVHAYQNTAGNLRTLEGVLQDLGNTLRRSSSIMESLVAPMEFRLVAGPGRDHPPRS